MVLLLLLMMVRVLRLLVCVWWCVHLLQLYGCGHRCHTSRGWLLLLLLLLLLLVLVLLLLLLPWLPACLCDWGSTLLWSAIYKDAHLPSPIRELRRQLL